MVACSAAGHSHDRELLVIVHPVSVGVSCTKSASVSRLRVVLVDVSSTTGRQASYVMGTRC